MIYLGYYILGPDGEPQHISDQAVWAQWMEDNHHNRHVADNTIGDVRVSTVFLGLNHQFAAGPPLLFETMIFGGAHDQSQWRWSTRMEALAAHDQITAAIRNGRNPMED